MNPPDHTTIRNFIMKTMDDREVEGMIAIATDVTSISTSTLNTRPVYSAVKMAILNSHDRSFSEFQGFLYPFAPFSI